MINILLTKMTAAQNEVALSYHILRESCFLAVIFASTIEWTLISLFEFAKTEKSGYQYHRDKIIIKP